MKKLTVIKEILVCLTLFVLLVSSFTSCCMGRMDSKAILTQLVQLKSVAQPIQYCPIDGECNTNDYTESFEE